MNHRMLGLALAVCVLATVVAAAEAIRPWQSNPLYRRIATELDEVAAIDNHAHLLAPFRFDPTAAAELPLLLRPDSLHLRAVLRERLGLEWDSARPVESDAKGRQLRAERIAAAGSEAAYWEANLNDSRTEIVLINQSRRGTIDGKRMRWVPYAASLLTPFAPDHLGARNPGATAFYRGARARLLESLAEEKLAAPPATLAEYRAFIARQIARWKSEGAVALKFAEAYHRSLLFEEVPESAATALWERAQRETLPRADYLQLQDFLVWEFFRLAGEHALPVHIHSSFGAGPFLRLGDSDVRNLENVLTDTRFARTQFVLIHGGAPWHEAAAYLAGNKPNVWIDVSAMTLLYPVPDLAAALRKYLTFSPRRTLFSTDTMAYFGTPVGTEFVHLALSRHLREALYLCLADLVRDAVLTENDALELGRDVLSGNARRLYRF